MSTRPFAPARKGDRPRHTDATAQAGEEFSGPATVPGKSLRVIVVAGEFGGEEPCPRLESHVPLWLICLGRLFGEHPGGVPFTPEQFDDGEVKQRTGYSRPIFDCLATVERDVGIPSPLAQVACRRTEQSEVGKAQVLAAAIPQLPADPQGLSQMTIGGVERSLVALDASQMVESVRQPRR